MWDCEGEPGDPNSKTLRVNELRPSTSLPTSKSKDDAVVKFTNSTAKESDVSATLVSIASFSPDLSAKEIAPMEKGADSIPVS
jgi:hypothetical protein